MITPINEATPKQMHKKSNTRYQNIKYSGYISLGALGICSLTGLRQVKFPKKFAVHKISAILAGISGLWHLGAIKRWDNIFHNNK